MEAHARFCALGLQGCTIAQVYEASAVLLETGKIVIRKPVLDLIRRFEDVGHVSWILTGSVNWVAWALADRIGIPRNRVIGVKLEVLQDRIHGRGDLHLNVGQGKVDQWHQRVELDPVLAIGDSMSDLPILRSACAAGILLLHSESPLREEVEAQGLFTWSLESMKNP